MPNGWYAGFQKADSQQMVKEYIAKYGGTPSDINADVAEAYSVGQVVAQAVQANNSLDNAKIISVSAQRREPRTACKVPSSSTRSVRTLAGKTLTFQWQKGALEPILPTSTPGSKPPRTRSRHGWVSGRLVHRPANRARSVEYGLLQAIVDGMLTGGVYALMAAGLSLIFGVMDIINIAQGAMVVLGAYLSYVLSVHLGIDLLLGLADHRAGDVPARCRNGVLLHAPAARTRTGPAMSILVTLRSRS